MNFKDLKLGAKLAIGFGALIALAVALGVVAIINMNNVKTNSTYLAEEYVPEVKIANDIERNSLLTMFEMRTYGYTEENDFYNKGIGYLADVSKLLKEARDLADKSSQLKALNEKLDATEKAVYDYEQKSKETHEINQKIAVNRKNMNESAGKYMQACAKFLEGQNERMEREIRSGGANTDRLAKITICNNIIDAGNAVRVANFQAQATRNPDLFKQAVANFESSFSSFDELRKYTRLEADLKLIDDTEEAAEAYKSAMENFLQNWFDREELAEKRLESANTVLANAQDIAVAGVTNTQEIADNAKADLGQASVIMIIGLIVALLLGIILAVIITRAISRPILKGVVFAQQVADGDLTATVDVDQKDEIGDLANALKGMVAKLQEIVANVIGGADNIAAASQQMSASSQQVSQGATEQASSAEEVSSSMEEMGSNIQQNTDNAKQTEQIAAKAATDIQTGSGQVNETVNAMKQIAEKVSIIGDIAFQTNILALNAAVEAARAGEHGKGFAVVAAEVRKLAERSQVAAGEIDDLSKSSVEVAERAGGLLNEIVPDIQKTSKLVEEITAASIEMSSGSDQVNNAIQQLNQVTQENAASAEEMATGSEELSSQADNLRDLISFFKIDDKNKSKAVKKTTTVKKTNVAKPTASKQKLSVSKPQQKQQGFDIDMNSNVSDSDFEKF